MRSKHILIPVSLFFGSRLIILLGVLFSTYLAPNPGLPDIPAINADILLHWDAGWYRGIAESGYSWTNDPNAQQNIIFFPLYPFLSGMLHKITGASVAVSMIVISNAAFLISLIWLYRYLYEEYTEDIALWSAVFISFFPTSMFFSSGYPESLSLLFSIATFHYLSKNKPLAAGVMAGIATLTRLPLIILAVPIFIHLLRKRPYTARHILFSCACLLLSVGGVIVYAAYLYLKFKDPLVFVKGYEAWKPFNQGEGNLLKILAFVPVIQDIKFHFARLSARTFDSIFFIFFLISSVWGVLQYRKPIFVYALVIILFSYVSHAQFSLISMGRYMLLAFPVFILMTQIFRGTVPRLVVLSLSSAMLFMHTVFFAKWYWAG
ncbi:MAG: glycosyltransferase family 39 protein [Deltaproteobacteria bacterium]|nr:glycosyltransferase family 39 protein [Deltaproteobacteria bacterium]